MVLSYSQISTNDSNATNAIQTYLGSDPEFLKLSQSEAKLTFDRDMEDDKKLQVGIDFAITKGVLDGDYESEPYHDIYVDGKTAEEVATEIVGLCDEEGGGGSMVVVICGLSGTGKGTTVSKIQKMLSEKTTVSCWSNGNIFRSVTLLAATYCEKHGCDISEALSKENLETFMGMLSFSKNEETGGWDTFINGLGFENVPITTIQNTTLKGLTVSKNIPSVAKETQGEVINFAAGAIEKMVSTEDGIVVLLEGRVQTVNYVKSKNKFFLRMKDDSVIGKRRAAQRLMGAALTKLSETAGEDQVESVLQEELKKMVDEIKQE